jgi:hypothetical protein
MIFCLCFLNAKAHKFHNFENIDATKLLGKEMNFQGMIGDDIQMMGIVFLSTTRINRSEYEITGKSKVRNNICDFKGIQSVTGTELESGEDSPNMVDGKIAGKYCFYEDNNQSGTGFFDGVFEIYYAYYSDSIIGLADIWYTQSDYTILFDGNWKSYRTGKIKKACWSDYKACFPTDFNTSDGPDLIPNEKYRAKGWGWIIDIYSSDTGKRKKAEREFHEEWENWWR